MSNTDLIDTLAADGVLEQDDFEHLLSTYTTEDRDHAIALAYRIARERFGTNLSVWGVVDISNNCTKDCFYCALCRDNTEVERYRLSVDEIVDACADGHALGFRSVVLRSGEDPEFTDDLADTLIWKLRKLLPDTTIGLSFGEKTRATYQRYFDAGADRYLLRHETADPEHYAQLHPRRSTLANRIRALEDLKSIGFATGVGMLVGMPFQTPHTLAQDLAFIADFEPASVQIGPFLPAHSSKFADQPAGKLAPTLFVLALVRLILPDADLPVLTSVATVHPRGREMAVMAGANVVLPNLTPAAFRGEFAPFDHMVANGPEAGAGLARLRDRMAAIGYALT